MAEPKIAKHTLVDKWSPSILAKGYTELPNLLLYNLRALKISNTELATLVAILSFRWDKDDPYPSVGTVAKLVHREERTVRKHLRSLENKGIIWRGFRPNKSTAYDINPLIIKLNRLAKNAPSGQKRPVSPDNNVIADRSIVTAKENSVEKDSGKKLKATTNSLADEVILYWTEKTQLPINNRLSANRKAALSLLSIYGVEKVRQLIDGSTLALNDKYAPTIGDLCQLNDKANQLIAWGRKRQGGVRII